MSVYITGMEMPENCTDCEFCYDMMHCQACGEKMDFMKMGEERLPQCPLVEVPDPDRGDLISRADAMGAVQDHFNDGGFKGYGDGQRMMDRINTLPSAEAVQGEWIEKGGELVCSVCGNSVSFSRTPKGWVLGKFCQSCGAKMNKGGE